MTVSDVQYMHRLSLQTCAAEMLHLLLVLFLLFLLLSLFLLL